MVNGVMHFEIPAVDVQKLKQFYVKGLGWKIQKTHPGMDYWHIKTGKPGINGGMLQKVSSEHKPTNYVGVKSVRKSFEKLLKLGALSIMEPKAIPKTGYSAIVLDPEGNMVGLWQADKKAK